MKLIIRNRQTLSSLFSIFFDLLKSTTTNGLTINRPFVLTKDGGAIAEIRATFLIQYFLRSLKPHGGLFINAIESSQDRSVFEISNVRSVFTVKENAHLLDISI